MTLLVLGLGVAIVVILGILFATGAFEKSRGPDSEEASRLALAKGWRSESTMEGSRKVTRIFPDDQSWVVVLKKTEVLSTGRAPVLVSRAGGSGISWQSRTPALNGFLAVVPGEVKQVELDEMQSPLLAPLLERVFEELAGGKIPVPQRLEVLKTGDPVFDGQFAVVGDAGAERLGAEVRKMLLECALKPAMVWSGAGVRLVMEGGALGELVSCGIRVRAGL